jgi:diguanylate cyclase (GGDEF)-like protein
MGGGVMNQLVACITEQHAWQLLVLALAICAAGNLTAVFMLSRARQRIPGHGTLWLVVSGFVLGGTIWATHYIAMLSYDMSSTLSYQLWETVLSIIAAVSISILAAVALHQVSGRQGVVLAGILLGLAIATMHAIGLTAMRASASIETDIPTTAIAWLLGIVMAVSGTLVLSRQTSKSSMLTSAMLFVVAISSHHLISMSGLEVEPLLSNQQSAFSYLDRIGIAIGVCIVSTVLIMVGVAALLIERHLTDVKGLANASFEALVLVREGQIVDANERFAALVGRRGIELKGLEIAEFLTERSSAQDLLLTQGSPVPVEIVKGCIEFRGRKTDVISLRDIRERLEADRQLRQIASHDPLTGLLNRGAFNSQCEISLGEAAAGGTTCALLTVDLDRFKIINDLHGHQEGDYLLQQVAAALKEVFNGSGAIGRMGGDEFCVLLPSTSLIQAHASASDFLDRLGRLLARSDRSRGIGSSVGVALYPDHGITLRQLQGNSDAALYRAKRDGRGRICVFDRVLDQQLRERRRLEEQLRQAVEKEEFFLVFQPIVNAISCEPEGYEALLRWQHPTYGVLAPPVFIAAAEESGSILEIGGWALRTACMAAASWPDNLFVAVNLSARQLLKADLLDDVADAIETSGISADRLELEVTETSLLEDRADIATRLQHLKRLGVKIVMDDYGSGYSSMTNLRRYPFDKIKIDRSYVAALGEDPIAEVIIDCTMTLAYSLDLEVVVEGIETEEQYHRVAAKRPSQLQGYLFGRPAQVLSGTPHIPTRLRSIS